LKVKINTLKLIEELQKDLVEYEDEFVKAMEAYKTKLENYSDYVQAQVMKKVTKHIESPPYPPSSKREQFENDLKVLNAHVGDTIVMEDKEYKDMKLGIENLKHTMSDTTANYIASCYPS